MKTVVTLALLISASVSPAQELDPRRWSHLPVDTNFFAAAWTYANAEISDQPALRLENVQKDSHTLLAKYIRSFELVDRTARIEITQGFQQASWDGLLDGEPRSTSRSGPTDTIVRFGLNLLGAPPLDGEAFARYRASQDVETIVGMAVAVHLPTGDYREDRLVNIGANRFVLRPQIGVVHNRGKWSAEATLANWHFADNDEFFNGNKLETSQMTVLQGHLTYSFRPNQWVAASAGYGAGARSTLNGVRQDDRKQQVAWALTAGTAISRSVSVKAGYVGLRRRATNGEDTDTFNLGVSTVW